MAATAATSYPTITTLVVPLLEASGYAGLVGGGGDKGDPEASLFSKLNEMPVYPPEMSARIEAHELTNNDSSPWSHG